MIVTTDIGNILYRDCKDFGIDIVPAGETLTGELTSERIVIHTKKQQLGKFRKKTSSFSIPATCSRHSYFIPIGRNRYRWKITTPSIPLWFLKCCSNASFDRTFNLHFQEIDSTFFQFTCKIITSLRFPRINSRWVHQFPSLHFPERTPS